MNSLFRLTPRFSGHQTRSYATGSPKIGAGRGG